MTQNDGAPIGGGGDSVVPEAPSLPDSVPGVVQDLLNGLFEVPARLADGLGDLVSGLADAIGRQAGAIVVDVVGVLV